MAKKEESSVLFSLRELRQLEDDRVQKESSDAAAKASAEAQSKADAERRVREEEERIRREEEDRVRMELERREGADREERIRIAESERRAQVDAQMKLEQERLHLDHQAKLASAPTKSHKLLYGIVAAMSIIVVTLGIVYYRNTQQAARDKAKASAELKQLQDEVAENLAASQKLETEFNNLQARIKTASGEELKRLQEEADSTQRKLADARDRTKASQEKITRKSSGKKGSSGPKLDLDVDTTKAIGNVKGQ